MVTDDPDGPSQGATMDNVLIGFDGSEDARMALRWAARIATELDIGLKVVQAWQYPSDAILSVGRLELPSPERAEEHLEQQLRLFVEEELGAGPERIDLKVARGPAAGVLLRAISADTRMAVVGSRGLGGFKGLLLGSVSRQVLEHAPCPVTVVGPTVTLEPIRLETIVVAIDGSTHAGRALRFAGQLTRRTNAKLVVAHAIPPTSSDQREIGEPRRRLDARRDLVEEWCGPLREAGIDHQVLVVEGDARSALLEVAHDRDADLLVVGSRGLGPVAKLLIGSVAGSLAQHGELPVTIVPAVR
jgi:nucleotide-binding universal stress UspA family protein